MYVCVYRPPCLPQKLLLLQYKGRTFAEQKTTERSLSCPFITRVYTSRPIASPACGIRLFPASLRGSPWYFRLTDDNAVVWYSASEIPLLLVVVSFGRQPTVSHIIRPCVLGWHLTIRHARLYQIKGQTNQACNKRGISRT